MSLSRKLEAGENSEFESPGDIQDVGRAPMSIPSECVSGDNSEGKESERLSCDDSYNEFRSDTWSTVLTLDFVRFRLKILSAKELERLALGPPFLGDALGQPIPNPFRLPLSDGVVTGEESSDDIDMLSRG